MKFDLLLVDCPWGYNSRAVHSNTRFGGGATGQYPVLTEKDLFELKDQIHAICAKDCLMLLWAVYPKMDIAIDLIRAWEFKWSTRAFTWLKVYKNARTTFFKGPGAGTACLTGDSIVYTYNKVNQRVQAVTLEKLHQTSWWTHLIWSPSGWRQIRNVVKNKDTQCHTYLTNMGTLTCSTNHKLFFKAARRKHVATIEGKKIRENEHFIVCDTSDQLKQQWESKSDRLGRNLLFSKVALESPTPITAINEFELTEDLGWLVGLYVAEGSIPKPSNKQSWQICWSLHIDEEAYQARIKHIIDNLGLKQDRFFRQDVHVGLHTVPQSHQATVYCSSKKLMDLISSFVQGRGEPNKRLNLDLLLQTPVAFRRGLFHGMVDGDGHIKDGKHIRIGLCNVGLIDDLRKLCHSLGIPTSGRYTPSIHTGKLPNGKMRTTKQYMLYVLSGQQPHSLSFENTPIHLVEIQDVIHEPRYTFDTYDLTVEGEVFIVNDIISHNSLDEVCVAAYRGKYQAPMEKLADGTIYEEILDPVIITPHPRYAPDHPDPDKRNKIIHSAKPEEVRNRIERLWPFQSKLEIFARSLRPGWNAIGLDLTGNDVRVDLDLLAQDSVPEIPNVNPGLNPQVDELWRNYARVDWKPRHINRSLMEEPSILADRPSKRDRFLTKLRQEN